MNKARISNITQTKNGTETEKIKKEENGSNTYNNIHQTSTYQIKKRQNLIKWVEKTKISQSTRDNNIITDNTWQKSNMINY